MNKSYKKYFVIGFNKTATSTFHNLFLENNLTSQHTTRWNTDKYECFSDNGHLNNYKKLDLKYENSIFILNVRELDKWLISRFNDYVGHVVCSRQCAAEASDRLSQPGVLTVAWVR